MTAAALGAATDAATVHLTGVTATAILDVTTGTNGYESLTVDSGGSGANVLHLNTECNQHGYRSPLPALRTSPLTAPR